MNLTLDVIGGGDHINSDKGSFNCYFARKYPCEINSNDLNFTLVLFELVTYLSSRRF